ncbi:dipeptidyl aminopeptidase/acylaminoacyl peptidase [Chitinophaga niastensis]|uniref:Dipeptidyl aminopeptidase/acylaminoacyl peptidase n=1 Tax=Chitinophaga niastensis TaxID=536980 RepID=A0A2P8HQ73_CHINA|nr:prolyl oligopeptidase family serine peptidase [Chitinophaga niastensis]PSL48359.1 dipeptidyl aminopeptidase/acylaminoacyl peptidase [Chitinophaga niastensis]
MKKLFVLLFFTFFVSLCLSQNLSKVGNKLSPNIDKPPLNFNVNDKWPSVEGTASISNDGNYVAYTIENQPVGGHTLVLQATKGRWEIEIQGGRDVIFTEDSHLAILSNSTDSVCIIALGGSSMKYIPHVASFKLYSKDGGSWLACQLSTPVNELVVWNLKTAQERRYLAVNDYLFSTIGKVLVLQTSSKNDSSINQSLSWVNLDNGSIFRFWQGTGACNVVLDAKGTQTAFAVENKIDGQIEKSFWYYKVGTAQAVSLATNQAQGIDKGLALGSIQHFSKDGERLFFTLEEKERPKLETNDAQVDVWSYIDTKLQSQQLNELGPNSYTGVIQIHDHHIIRLENENERILLSDYDNVSDTLTMIFHQESDGRSGEEKWNPACKLTRYLISTKNGERKIINWLDDSAVVEMSPEGKFMIYYDNKQKSYFTYETGSGIIHNLTHGIAVNWEKEYGKSIEGWMKNDKGVIIYDHNDVWKLDPTGLTPPLNLTNGYGRKHNIVFSLALNNDSHNLLAMNEQLIFTAFNQNTKENGFYGKALGKRGNPDSLAMGPFVYNIIGNPFFPNGANFSPIKAINAQKYIVRRMSANESPNYFSTTDFKSFDQLSDLHPEKEYNWYSTELCTWKSLDNSTLQGILYKPENFDPQKKYPVIFHYYELKSDELNVYLKPEALTNYCTINIPSYVSNGYLVFCPDIRYTIGDPMQGTYNSVVSAAEYISKLPYVDSSRMGIQGCSWGGIQTNYLVTHTNLFAAACSASGISDWISGYGSLSDFSSSFQGLYESGQYRMGASLWAKPDSYIKNSAVLWADNVTTPFLMMHTKNDKVCPFTNAVEFFTALRHLGKISWMLVYNGNHGILGKDGDDFSIRMTQFFDHYLKDKPAPKWMTKGIPAKMKGIDNGLEVDDSIRTPGPGLFKKLPKVKSCEERKTGKSEIR